MAHKFERDLNGTVRIICHEFNSSKLRSSRYNIVLI